MLEIAEGMAKNTLDNKKVIVHQHRSNICIIYFLN